MTDRSSITSLMSAALLMCTALIAPGAGGSAAAQQAQASAVSLSPAAMPRIGTVDPRFQSYNIEMVEVIGGRFWKPYAKSGAAAAPKPEGPGELAALAWLVERLAQAAAQKSAGARVLDIDFESLLADLEQTMMRIAAHFRLDASPASIAALASSPVLTRYSKAPHRLGFSPAHRAAMMQKARDIHAAEIRKGLALLARLQKNYPLPF